MTGIRELNDAELDTASGAMTCETARVVAQIHMLTATALEGLGKARGGAFHAGAADGMIQASCPQE